MGTKGVGMDGGLPGFLFDKGLTKGGFGTYGGLTGKGMLALGGAGKIAELAGFTKTDIDLEIDEDLLTISGKSPQKDDNQQTYYLRELKRSSFRRSFKINDNVAMDNVSAKFDNGLLTISLPRVKEEVKEAKKVTIS